MRSKKIKYFNNIKSIYCYFHPQRQVPQYGASTLTQKVKKKKQKFHPITFRMCQGAHQAFIQKQVYLVKTFITVPSRQAYSPSL